MAPGVAALCDAMQICLGGPATRIVAVGQGEIEIVIRDIVDEECWAYLGTVGLCRGCIEAAIGPCELILRVDGAHAIEELERLALRVGEIAAARVRKGLGFEPETIVDDVELPLYAGMRSLLVTDWGGEYNSLPGIEPTVPLLELKVLFPREAAIVREVGSDEVFARFWAEGINRADPAREEARLDEREPSSEDDDEDEVEVDDRPARSIDAIWDDIEPWLAANAPRIHEGLRPGATAEQLKELEAAIGEPLPADVRDWFVRHDGAPSIRSYDFLPARRVVGTWRGLNALLDDGTFLDGRAPDDDSGERFQPVWWHRSWLPLAEDGCGNLICVDLAPGPAAVRGQILFWEMRTGPEASSVRSIAAWFELLWNDLATGKEIVDEEGFLQPGP